MTYLETSQGVCSVCPMVKCVIFIKVGYFNFMLLSPLVVYIMPETSIEVNLGAVVYVTSHGKLARLNNKLQNSFLKKENYSILFQISQNILENYMNEHT